MKNLSLDELDEIWDKNKKFDETNQCKMSIIDRKMAVLFGKSRHNSKEGSQH